MVLIFMRVKKLHRHRLISRMLSAGPVRSQEELRAMLESAGVAATQGTLSRDLHELGVVKGASGYTLPASPSNGVRTTDLGRALETHLLSSDFAGNIVVLKTEPGHAGLLASEVDRASLSGVVGSLAGDDTVFLTARTPKVARSLSLQLAKLAGAL